MILALQPCRAVVWAAWVEWITKLSVPQRRCTLRNTIDELDAINLLLLFRPMCPAEQLSRRQTMAVKPTMRLATPPQQIAQQLTPEIRLRNDHERHRRTTKSVRL